MKSYQPLLAHSLPILVFFLLSCLFFAPLFMGKTLVQSDNVQLSGTNAEISDYRDKGETIRWSNREFGGMPRLGGSDYSPFKYVQQALFYGFIPKPVMMLFVLFLGVYVMFQVLGLSNLLSAIGGFAFAFSSFNLISLEAGHDNKVIAMAFMAPVLAGIILTYQGKFWKGGILTFIAAGFQLFYGHIQITYYLLLMVVAYMLVVIWQTKKENTWPQFGKATGVLVFATLMAVGCNFTKLYSTYEYSSYSTRGGSELTSDEGEKRTGLDKEYALSWSNGKLETLTVLFPYFYGGATGESLSKSSTTYKELQSRNVPQATIESVVQNIPLYWGDQPFTAGPIYFGISICFLFVLGLFLIKGPIKWWAVALTILAFLLSMGKNLEWFTDIFFYYVPLYNKFRSVTMIMSVAQLSVVFFGFLALHEVLKKEDSVLNAKHVLKSVAVIGGIGIFFLLFKGAFFDFATEKDGQYGFPQWLVNAMVEDRKSKFNQDILRGLFFLIVTGGALWMFLKEKISLKVTLGVLIAVVFIDLWIVDKRYLSQDDYKKKSVASNLIQKTPADERILRDDSYYRVFNVTKNPFSDGTTSFFHNSIGGYNAIKFQRYQDLIDRYLSNMNQPVLNMLNTKYFIVSGANNQPLVQANPGALGNAWMVNEVEAVESADDEIKFLEDFNPGEQAVVGSQSGYESATYSAVGTVELTTYHPERMTYSFESAENQFVVFSEIYYKPGWNVYLDGKQMEYARVDYVLRGMEVPAGSHLIEFKFEPVSERFGDKLAIGSSLLMLLWFVGGFFLSRKRTVTSEALKKEIDA